MFMGALAGATIIRYAAVSQLSVIQTMLIGLFCIRRMGTYPIY